MKRLGYIVSQFPEMHETFILREVLALKAAGVPLHIYSLKTCRDRIVHEDARPLMVETEYIALGRPSVWAAAALEALRHPLRASAGLAWTLRTHPWPPATLVKAVAVWWQSLALVRCLRRDGITHLHAHWATMPTTAAVLASRWLRCPFSFTAHAWDIFVPNPSLPEKVRLASKVFTCTDYNRRYLAHWCPDAKNKVVLNYHGVDLTQFRPSSGTGDVPLFLSVGRLVETKGFETLLEAYALLRARGTIFRAVIVGQGPLRARLAEQIEATGLAGHVELRPSMHQEALRRLYGEAFAFVLPSVVARNGDRDGIPNVILEAMAMGLPVIATTVSGIPEAVQDRRTGMLVPPKDPERLAEACELLLQKRRFARVLGDHGRMWVETQFDEREHMQRLTRHMTELLEPAGGARRRIRVLHVVWSMAVGGAERVIALLATHADPVRFESLVACLNEPGTLAEELRQAGISVFAMHKRGPLDMRAFWRLRRLIRTQRVGVVHTHLWGANVWGRLAAWSCGVPVVTTEHNVDSWKSPRRLALDRLLLPITGAFVAVSDAVKVFYALHGIPQARIEVVRNGIEVEQFPASRRSLLFDELGWPEHAPAFASIGRLAVVKDHAAFVDAMAEVLVRCPEARGLIVGEGPLRAQLQARIEARGLVGRVVLTGVRQDVPEILRGCRALVLPSTREGLPMVVLEAMASGVPVIATAVGGLSEVIEDGRTGWLLPHDAHLVARLAERLTALAGDAALSARVGAAGQAVVRERFSVQAMTRSYERLYAQLAAPRRRIALIIDDLDVGGAQRQLLEMAQHLPKDRFEVSVIALSATRLQLAEEVRAAGVPVYAIAQSGAWSWSCWRSLYRLLRVLRPQLVHTWLFTADLYGRSAAWAARVPRILSAVRSVEPWKPGRYVLVDRVLRRITDAFTVNAGAIGDVLTQREGVPPAKIITVYNGVDLARFDPAAANGAVRQQVGATDQMPVVGIVGRLSPEKDHATFLQAAVLVATQRPQARFLILGSGALREELRALAVQLGLEGAVRFLGAQADVREVFAALDLLVVSSRYEGCCNVILEGMAMGKPVVATAVGGNPELVKSGQTGWLVPAQDPAAMAQAMLRVIDDPQMAAAMGREGRRQVEARFSTERMIEQTASLYERLLDGRSRR